MGLKTKEVIRPPSLAGIAALPIGRRRQSALERLLTMRALEPGQVETGNRLAQQFQALTSGLDYAALDWDRLSAGLPAGRYQANGPGQDRSGRFLRAARALDQADQAAARQPGISKAVVIAVCALERAPAQLDRLYRLRKGTAITLLREALSLVSRA